MIWASIIIPMGVGLFLGYTLQRSMLNHKAVWRNWLASISLLLVTVPPLVGIFFLPKPWQDYALSGLFILCSALLWLYIITSPRRKKRAGSLLWNLGWPGTHKTMFITGIIWIMIALLQTSIVLDLAEKEFAESYNRPEYYISQIIFYWSTVIYFLWAGLSRLELRENGIYFKFGFIEWNKIAAYKWKKKEGNILTVWIKQRFPLFPTASWEIPEIHKPTIDRMLSQHLSGRLRKY